MANACSLSPDEQSAIQRLRDRGFAVVVFNPDELEGGEAEVVETRLVELGWDVIQGLMPSASTDAATYSDPSRPERLDKP